MNVFICSWMFIIFSYKLQKIHLAILCLVIISWKQNIFRYLSKIFRENYWVFSRFKHWINKQVFCGYFKSVFIYSTPWITTNQRVYFLPHNQNWLKLITNWYYQVEKNCFILLLFEWYGLCSIKMNAKQRSFSTEILLRFLRHFW